MGAIADLAASMLPTTWAKLSGLAAVGPLMLQKRVEINKRLYMSPSAYVDEAGEAGLDEVAQAWLAMRTVCDVVPTGVDFWMNQRVNASTPEEHAEYGNRVDALEKLRDELKAQIDELKLTFQSIVGPYSREVGTSPRSDTEGLPLVTPNPMGMPKGFGLFLPRVLTEDYFFQQTIVSIPVGGVTP